MVRVVNALDIIISWLQGKWGCKDRENYFADKRTIHLSDGASSRKLGGSFTGCGRRKLHRNKKLYKSKCLVLY